MASGEKFLPKPKRTIEVNIGKGLILDAIADWLHRLGYIKPSEELTSMVVDLPDNIPVKYTFKKGGIRTT